MSIAWNSDVDLHIDIAFGDDPFDASPTWTDVAQYAYRVTITRGRPSVSTEYAAGRAQVFFRNDDGRFDPNNSSSPYSPDVVLMVPIRIRATYNVTTYELYRGFVRQWDLQYPAKGKMSNTVAHCTDALELFNYEDLINNTYSEESTDTRIGNVLDDVGFPAGWRNLAGGVADVQVLDLTDTPKNALLHLRECAIAEQGNLFVAADGDVTLYDRTNWQGGSSSNATFGPSNLEYTEVTVDYDDQQLFTQASITRDGGDSQAASDATAVAAYGGRTFTHSGGAMVDDNGALNVAEIVVEKRKTVEPRVTSLELAPADNPSTHWPQALGRDLADAITVIVDPPGGGTDLNQKVHIESIHHDIDVDGAAWLTRWGSHPISAYEEVDFWELNVSNLGTDTNLA